jgi:hypothetical protein
MIPGCRRAPAGAPAMYTVGQQAVTEFQVRAGPPIPAGDSPVAVGVQFVGGLRDVWFHLTYPVRTSDL